jgi:siroheme synthase-like protein
VIGYPVSLVHLDRARCLVVGGGSVAARKATGLLEAQARIVVVSPTLCERLEILAGRGDIDVIRRAYRPGDLEGAFLAIAATSDPDVNQQIWEEAKARGILVNVVDDPAHCTFIAPAVMRRGPLAIAISTSGRCPALSRHIRQRLEEDYGAAYGPFVELLGELREQAVSALPLSDRNAFWKQLFHSDVLVLLASGDEAAARQRALEILSRNMSRGI